jgi:tRNA(Ile)-lysidine synthase
MKISIQPGKYVVAVSGGVDSMALLHVLGQVPGLELVVAHYDHGIRADSGADSAFVRRAAKSRGLPFVSEAGNLGSGASEATARQARYAFLDRVRETTGAAAIITAHHKDDVLETAIINIIRGTGRLGLSSLRDSERIRRPLLHVSKAEITSYAESHGLTWHEDSTNADPTYLRNHIRHNILPRLGPEQQEMFYTYIIRAHRLNPEIDNDLDGIIKSQNTHGQYDRTQFILLPHKVALEVMAAWLRGKGIRSFDKKVLERLVQGAKMLHAGSSVSIDGSTFLAIGTDFLALNKYER